MSGFSAFSVFFTNVLLSAFFSAFNAFFDSFLGFHAKSSKGKQNLEKLTQSIFLFGIHLVTDNFEQEILRGGCVFNREEVVIKKVIYLGANSITLRSIQ